MKYVIERFKVVLAILALLVFPSCSKRVNISLNTYANESSIPAGFTTDASFYVVAKGSDNPLVLKEIEQKITGVLAHRGYTITNKYNAHYRLEFSIETSSEKRIIQAPRYLVGHGSSLVTSGYYSYSGLSTSMGYVYVPEEKMFYTTTLNVEVFKTFTFFDHDPLWYASATTIDEISDNRKMIDYLVVSILNSFGKNSKKKVVDSVAMTPDYLSKNLTRACQEK